jgi:predicted RNase H-like HicB family nuclease
MEAMTYTVIYEGSDASGWSGYVPDLPGVAVGGETLDEARTLMRKAIELHLRGMREDGLEIPIPHETVVEQVAVPA